VRRQLHLVDGEDQPRLAGQRGIDGPVQGVAERGVPDGLRGAAAHGELGPDAREPGADRGGVDLEPWPGRGVGEHRGGLEQPRGEPVGEGLVGAHLDVHREPPEALRRQVGHPREQHRLADAPRSHHHQGPGRAGVERSLLEGVDRAVEDVVAPGQEQRGLVEAGPVRVGEPGHGLRR
jgi:hypothetical protein